MLLLLLLLLLANLVMPCMQAPPTGRCECHVVMADVKITVPTLHVLYSLYTCT